MASAGKILLMPKGVYDSETTYSTLDWVRYGGKAWVCKQNSTGNTPAENTYWTELCEDGIDGENGESYYMYIRYSENSDGTDFVSTPTVDTIYIGFYTGNSNTAPTDKALYTWSKYVGSGGGGTGAWGDITGKPFNSVGSDGLKVASGILDADLTKVQAILNDATTSVSGKMSATDKARLDGIATGANNYTLPTASDSVKGGIKIGANLTMDGDTLNATGGGGGIAPSNASNIVAKEGNAIIKLTWQDPNDTYVDGNLLCTWRGTKVVYKTGSYPTSETDGTLAVDSTARNAYSDTPLTITGLTNDTPYYIALFPYSDQGVVNKNIANRITATPQAYVLYGYKRTKADSNPATRLVATDMAVGMGKATMNTSTGAIDLASWTNAWFVEGNKPVMMKYDGTIDYELDPNDYTKKADGTASDVANSSYAGNAMALFPTCWVKRWEDSTYEYFQVCDIQLDSDFKAYAHQREDGSIMEWFARSIYDGANVSSKIRSISGLAPCNTIAGGTQLGYAQANGSLWDSDTWSRVALIWDLLTLMSLNDDVQTAWGYGWYTGMSQASHLNAAGLGNTEGQFWGKRENNTVKVFHLENFWGNIWKIVQGLVYNTTGKYGVKMTAPYNNSGSGYTATSFGLSGTSGGYQSAHNMSEYGCLPTTASGSDSTYIPDGAWWDTTQQNFARFGCSGYYGLVVGRALTVAYALSYSTWGFGLALTCEQPLAS